jgi:hypothetical protein
VSEIWTWLISSIALAVLSLVLLLRYAGSTLRLEAGGGSKLWTKLRRAMGLSVITGLIMISLLASPAYAFQGEQSLSISIDSDYRLLKVGDQLEFDSLITNNRPQASPPLIVAMNVINLDAMGEIVDPEDWSPQRTQYINSLAPYESADLDWIINPILEGNFMVYMTLIPQPATAETTSHPVASSGIHLTVAPFTRLNPGGVLPIAIGEPLFLLAITFFVYRRRRQQIDIGGSS